MGFEALIYEKKEEKLWWKISFDCSFKWIMPWRWMMSVVVTVGNDKVWQIFNNCETFLISGRNWTHSISHLHGKLSQIPFNVLIIRIVLNLLCTYSISEWSVRYSQGYSYCTLLIFNILTLFLQPYRRTGSCTTTHKSQSCSEACR